MGSDRYFWGRESMSKNPQTPRQLENEKRELEDEKAKLIRQMGTTIKDVETGKHKANQTSSGMRN